MKKMVITAFIFLLFALSFTFTAAQKIPPVKRVQVTSKTIAGRLPGPSLRAGLHSQGDDLLFGSWK